ncbi:HVO_A0556 family zinc finger protein [Halocalculus aciditolerans]|uniref:Small CPxCG-related zinc finger protein n=1 Tax=Halocalculus aciditolerans TaxID=1383812 RepID=A0A830FLP4_9EURY|nr:HVO_A0556 family zinc finger protein [Halocalculus aciditolerans]GGL68049.1 hypothetical protein GCM10009039_27570 [Halocalculus aciditolerans]
MSSTHTSTSLVGRLDGDDCAFCDDGTLVRGTYKDNDAVLCEACGTPTLQRF